MDELIDLYALNVDRPWLRASFISTIDGAAYADDHRTAALGGAIDTKVFALLRSLCDVVLVGANTARIEKYAPITTQEIDEDLRQRLGLKPLPVIAVVSRSLDIPAALDHASTLIFTTASQARQHSFQTAEVIGAGEESVTVTDVINELARRNLFRINVEGGPTLHGELINADLIDDICLTIDPTLQAGNAPRIAHSPHVSVKKMTLAHIRHYGDVILTRYVSEREPEQNKGE